ncbi:MAG TPA: hypothetical protein VGN26_07705 [Armatimonadota bacterium]|jgi:hypothetical protein
MILPDGGAAGPVVIALPALGASLLLVTPLCVAGWKRLAQGYLDHMAAPPLPDPNAYDEYVELSRRLGPPALEPPEQPLPEGDGFPERPAVTEAERLARDRRQVEASSKILAGIRRALPMGYQEPLTWVPGGSPHYQYRQMACLLSAEGRLKEQDGDLAGALASYLDVIEMGVQIGRNAVYAGLLVGLAVEAIGLRRALMVAERLCAEDARVGARRLEQIAARRSGFVDPVMAECRLGLVCLLDQLQQLTSSGGHRPSWRPSRGPLSGDGPTPELGRDVRRHGKEGVVRGFVSMMDRHVSEAAGPYVLATWDVRARGRAGRRQQVPEWVALWSSTGRSVWTQYLKSRTGMAVLLVRLALQAYHLEHGRHAECLGDLVPEYLSEAPDDPFAASGPLICRREGEGFTLYSVGPDGVDDGGRPIEDPKGEGRLRHAVFPGSRGDIVSGVNTW